MRPRLLELTAFGPYPEQVRVDFDALAAEGLFLIHGPTGAGKSSLLDGLTYALYGGVPGTRRPDRLRSDHADPHVATAVTLEFSLHGHDYRITRVPPHERAKRSGVGMTLQKAKATLCRRDGDTWSPLAEGVEEVGTHVVALLGLNRQQFQQVVVLPQGDFARALQADANERRRLLSSLFHTHRFAEYTQRLLDRARTAEGEAIESTAALERLFAAAVERWQIITADSTDPAPPPALAAGAVAVVDQARAALQAAKTGEREASEALARTTLAAHRHERVTAARQALAVLDATAADIEVARRTLAAARRAAPCIGVIEDAASAAAELARLDRRRVDCARVLRDLPEQLPADVTDAVELALSGLDVAAEPGDDNTAAGDGDGDTGQAAARVAAARDTVRDVQARLQAACERHGEWVQACEESRRQETLAAALLADSERAATRADAAAAILQELAEARDAALQSRERLGPQREEQAQLQAAAVAVSQLPAARAAAEAAAAQVLEAKAVVNAALDEQRQLLEQRISNMAGELAGQLQPGQPCGVCGSCEHPAPADSDGAPVSAKMLAAAAAAVTAARAHLDTAEREHTAAQEQSTTLTQAAGSFADRPDELAQRLTAVTSAISADTRAAEGLAAIEQRRSDCEAGAAADAATASRLAAESAAATNAAQQAATAAGALAETLQATFATLDDPTPVITAVDSIAAALDALWSVAIEHQAAWRTVATAQRRLRDALDEQGFTDADAALQAGCHATERDRLDQMIRTAEQERAAAETVLKEWDDDDGAHPPGDASAMQAAQVAKQDADRRLAAAQSRLAVVRQAAQDLTSLASRWELLQRDHHRLVADADRLRRLADICNGPGNAQRMSLERYVLAAYLEEIAEAASVRLAAISDGRYTVRHSDERVRGGGASGLSITILDAFTGTERDAGTLSGGETFQASLCLALAVAEVVQRHAGGVHLDTLFIDEGFGALDADALEQAMTELDALRAGGRLVGVISHVPVLRERICNAIEVRKTASGSDVRVVLPGEITTRCA